MSFRERSAWVMAVVTAVAGLWYLNKLVALSAGMTVAPAPIGLLLRYVIVTIIASIIAQVTLAVMTPDEAEAPADERERQVLAQAGATSSNVLAVGVLAAMAQFLSNGDGNLLFHAAFFSLVVAQIVEYLLQAVWLRRGA